MSSDFVPDVRDGLTAVERALLRVAGSPEQPYEKARSVLDGARRLVSGHDRQLVYDALVRLTSDHLVRHAPFDGQGNFGSIDDDPPAASIYTEIRRSNLGQAVLGDALEFDDATDPDQRARALRGTAPGAPAEGPSLGVLANGAWEGVSAIPPHNARELAAAIAVRLRNPYCVLEDVMAVMPGPDYPTGGVIVSRDEVRQAYRTGAGTITVRAAANVESSRLPGHEQLVVTQMPYLVSKGGDDGLIMDIVLGISRQRLTTVEDVRDESDRRGPRLVLELCEGADTGRTFADLYTETVMETKLPVLMVALDAAGKPRQWTMLELLDAVIDHQRQVAIANGVRDDAIASTIEARLTELAREFGDGRRTRFAFAELGEGR